MAKGKSKGKGGGGGGGAGSAQPIDFTGKETKEQLIQKLVDSGAYYDVSRPGTEKVADRVQFIAKEKKPELQIMVKRVNVDLEHGGRGNSSQWYSTNYNKTRNKVDAEIQNTSVFKRATEKFKKERDGGGASIRKAQDEINKLVDTKYYGAISKSERASYKKDVLAILAKYD
jgi:hypothetical protein